MNLKKSGLVFLTAVLFCALLVTSLYAQPTVTVTRVYDPAEPITPAVGSLVKFEVKARNVARNPDIYGEYEGCGLIGFQFYLKFGNGLRCTAIVASPLFPGMLPSTTIPEVPGYVTDYVAVAASTYFGDWVGVIGEEILLATLTFEVTGSGEAVLDLTNPGPEYGWPYDVLLTDVTGNWIPCVAVDNYFSNSKDLWVVSVKPQYWRWCNAPLRYGYSSTGFKAGNVDVTVVNVGTNSEATTITVKCGATVVGSQSVTIPGSSVQTFAIPCNTSNIPTHGYFLLSAEVSPVAGENATYNNSLSGCVMMVTLPGDNNLDTMLNVADSVSSPKAWWNSTPLGVMAYDYPGNYNGRYDYQQDGIVNIGDWSLLATWLFWGKEWLPEERATAGPLTPSAPFFDPLYPSASGTGPVNLSWVDASNREEKETRWIEILNHAPGEHPAYPTHTMEYYRNDGFEVWRSDDGGVTYTKIGTVKGNVTSFTDNTVLSPTAVYYYKVSAINQAGRSEFFGYEVRVPDLSRDITGRKKQYEPTIRIAAYSGTECTIRGSDQGNSGLEVWRSADGGVTYTKIGTPSIDGYGWMIYTDTGLDPNKTYYYKYRGTSINFGNQLFSNNVRVPQPDASKAPPGPPLPPGDPSFPPYVRIVTTPEATETTPARAGETIKFDGTGSYDPDGGSIVRYQWDFNYDGVYDAEGSIVYHAYPPSGYGTVYYWVRLLVTDDEGATSWTRKKVYVRD